LNTDLDVFYAALLLYLAPRLQEHQKDNLIPWRCLTAKAKTRLVSAFASAVAFFATLGVQQNHAVDKLIAQVVCDSETLKYKITPNAVADCLENFPTAFDDSYPGYKNSSVFVSMLVKRLT